MSEGKFHRISHVRPSRPPNLRAWLRPRVWAAAGAIVALIVVSATATAGRLAPAGTSRADQPLSSPSGVLQAKKLLKVDEASSKWVAPGPALNVGSKVSGKTIFYIANGLSLPVTQSQVAGVKEAAKAVGLKVTVTDGAGSASTFARLIQQAIGQKATVIVIQSEPTSALVAPIKAAKQARIPVISQTNGDPGFPTATERSIGVAALSTWCYSCVGASIAHYIVATSNGKANVVEVNVPDVGPDKAYGSMFKATMRKLCPACKVKTVSEPLAQWQTGLGSLTTSALKAGPSVNYLFPHYDGMVASMKPSVFALNAQKRVKIVSYNASLGDMQALAKPSDPEWADVGGSAVWIGWASVDQALRILLGKKPVFSENVPNRTFDKSNIRRFNLKANESTWYGVDFRTKYKKLWGVK
jgi:ribose transport system substrate-binding protein